MEDDTPVIDADLCHAVAADLLGRGQAGEAETFYRAALSLAPERPHSWSALGLAVLRSGRTEEALRCEREALRLDPDNPDTHNLLGIVLHAMHALAEAENHFRGALRLDPRHANATLNLGVIRQSLGHVEEALTLYRQARALGVDAARVANNLALALAETEDLDGAERECRAALAAAPAWPEAEVNLGMILLTRGRLAEAWPHYEARWRVPPLKGLMPYPADRTWTGAEPLEGKTILLHAEQGFGDTLQFCRYAPLVAARGARVILSVPRPLLRVMETLTGIDTVIAADDLLPPVGPPHDLHCPLLSLPRALGTTLDTIPAAVPYLSADPAKVADWDGALPRGRRIGLVWAGGARPDQPHAAAIDKRRSMRLADMAPLGMASLDAIPLGTTPLGTALPGAGTAGGCVFVSLQLGPAARQIAAAPFPIVDPTARLADFADTAALIQALDLVIAVDTAVAHLAGALGKPVWLLSRFDACWRWLRDRDDTPWYPTMRLFRQTAPGDWAGVVERVAEALSRTV